MKRIALVVLLVSAAFLMGNLMPALFFRFDAPAERRTIQTAESLRPHNVARLVPAERERERLRFLEKRVKEQAEFIDRQGWEARPD